MERQTQIEQALKSRDYQQLVNLLKREPAQALGPLVRTLRFARNMLALRDRDPDIAREIENAPSTGRVRITLASDQRETLALVGANPNPLCPGGSPTAVIEQTEARLREIPDPSRSIALAGVGDGHALARLAEEPTDSLGRQRVVYVIEPDAEVFRSAMMLHDWHHEQGPFSSGRFLLFVGDNWRERLLETLTPDSRLPLPEKAIRVCADPAPIRDALQSALGNIGEEIKARKRRIAGACVPRTPARVAERLRTPGGVRVMLLTTHYSTVLQYSTRDLAEGFNRIGCETRVVIEDHPWEQHLIASLLGEADRFNPDLVIQIDHHRHETPGVFPAQIPFVCIVQDNLPNLMSREASEKMGPTDFAAGSWIHRYVLEHGYPSRRSIEIPRLTRAPEAPAVHAKGDSGVDILYVSNHAATPEQAIENAVESIDPRWPAGREIVRACGGDLVSHYADGGCQEDEIDLNEFITESVASHNLPSPGPEAIRSLTDIVGVTINNPLYRQQGLRWVGRAAEELGLEFALYGRGWGEHPEFARYARGPIDYQELPKATARARLCMTLEPYFPTMHQRALDTWMWAGLPLVRRRRRETQQLAFNAWLDRLDRLGPGVDSYDAALASFTGDERSEFERVYRAQLGLHAWDGSGDLVRLYRDRRRRGIGYLMNLPPGYERIAFEDADGLIAIVRTLLDEPGRYGEIQRMQHDWVRARFSYERGASLLLEQIAANMPGV